MEHNSPLELGAALRLRTDGQAAVIPPEDLRMVMDEGEAQLKVSSFLHRLRSFLEAVLNVDLVA